MLASEELNCDFFGMLNYIDVQKLWSSLKLLESQIQSIFRILLEGVLFLHEWPSSSKGYLVFVIKVVLDFRMVLCVWNSLICWIDYLLIRKANIVS